MQIKLLLIDDDADARDVVSATLMNRGFEVVCAKTGGEALDRLERERELIDVVMSDLNMPGMSGLELCRRVKHGWPDLPVILVTAFRSDQTAVTATQAGAYAVVSKPLRLPELLLTLTRALAQRTPESESATPQPAAARTRRVSSEFRS